jgi:hypothetical protein
MLRREFLKRVGATGAVLLTSPSLPLRAGEQVWCLGFPRGRWAACEGTVLGIRDDQVTIQVPNGYKSPWTKPRCEVSRYKEIIESLAQSRNINASRQIGSQKALVTRWPLTLRR